MIISIGVKNLNDLININAEITLLYNKSSKLRDHTLKYLFDKCFLERKINVIG